MKPVRIYVKEVSPRVKYACWQIFPRMLGWSFKLMSDRGEFIKAEGAKLNYSENHVPGSFQIIPQGLLNTGAKVNGPDLGHIQNLPVIFQSDQGELGFDVFSAVFFQLSRMEEGSDLPQDEHGRPVSGSLLMVRHGLAERPLVDEWVFHFAEHFRASYPDLPVPVRAFATATSLDIDNGFMYLGRPLWRTVGSAVRDVLRGDLEKVRERRRVLRGLQQDPYDVYDHYLDRIKNVKGRKLAFVLVGDRGKYDHAVGLGDAAFRDRLDLLKEQCEIGVHPSYRSSKRTGLLKKEQERLSAAIDKPIELNRQHFLRFTLPGTYRQLEKNGIREDHSMGLHDHLGFRAGTCSPFLWYDLEQERESKLELWPFAVMDHTLSYKMKLDPEQALQRITAIINNVRAVNGTFGSLWHERFLSDHGTEKGWRAVFDQVMDELTQ